MKVFKLFKKILKIVLALTLLLGLMICFLAFYYFSAETQRTPWDERIWTQANYYPIDPSTLFNDIENGEKTVFSLKEDDTTTYPEVHPSGSFPWSSKDYFEIAKAHHFYIAEEQVSNGWDVLSGGSFYINQCQDNMQGFDSAEITFFKREPTFFPISYIGISPLRNRIKSIVAHYPRIEQKTSLDRWLNNPDTIYKASEAFTSPISAEDALEIAENAGGREMRNMLSNEGCRINLAYYSDRWVVWYRWNTDDLYYTVDFDIDANDGDYKITYDLDRCQQDICP